MIYRAGLDLYKKGRNCSIGISVCQYKSGLPTVSTTSSAHPSTIIHPYLGVTILPLIRGPRKTPDNSSTMVTITPTVWTWLDAVRANQKLSFKAIARHASNLPDPLSNDTVIARQSQLKGVLRQFGTTSLFEYLEMCNIGTYVIL